MDKIDNQQPSPSIGKVQRLSRKRVLSELITWETPRVHGKLYVYKLVSSRDNKERYIGSTGNPAIRLSHHLGINSLNRGDYKANWINKELRDGYKILMVVIQSHNTILEAVQNETYLISLNDNLTNLERNPIRPHTKPCYTYDTSSGEIIYFESQQLAAQHMGTDRLSTNNLKMWRWLTSESEDFTPLIQSLHSIKAKDLKTGEIKFFVSHKHAATILGCCDQAVNLALLKLRKSVNGWVIARRNEPFSEYINKHYRKVRCLDDGLVFERALYAAQHYNLDPSAITKVCKGTRRIVGRHTFEYVL